jgi:hypothetical protein
MPLILPGKTTVQGGPQSLGRQDVGAPLQVANARATTALAWTNTTTKIFDSYGTISKSLADADGLQQVGLRAMQDEAALATVDAYLSKPALAIGDEMAPPGADEQIQAYKDSLADDDPYKPTDVAIPSYKLAPTMFQEYSNRIAGESLKQIPEAYQGNYLNKVAPTVVNGTRKISAKAVTDHFDALKSKQNFMLEQSINALDEQGAIEVLMTGHASGLYTTQELNDKMAAIGPAIDYMAAEDSIRKATTQSDLDLAEDIYRNSRVTMEKRIALNKSVDGQMEVIKQRKEVIKTETYAKGMELYSRGKLTTGWVTDRLIQGNISGANAGALLTRLKQGSASVSVDAVINDLNAQIAQIRFVDPDEMSVTEKANALRLEMRKAASGVDDNGRIVGDPTITGDDYLKMSNALDEELAKLADRNPAYKDVLEELKIQANYSDYMSGIVGSEVNGRAYLDGKAALDKYMDMYGAAADPKEWLSANSKRYTLEVYRAEASKPFSRLFTKYAGDGWRMEPGNEMSPYDTDRIIVDAYGDAMKGDLDYSDLEQLTRLLKNLPAPRTTPKMGQ